MGKGEIVRNSLYGKLEKTLSYNEGNIQIDDPEAVYPDPEFGIPFGGVGIRSVRIDLNKHDGSLDYEATQNGRIRAIASWSTSEK